MTRKIEGKSTKKNSKRGNQVDHCVRLICCAGLTEFFNMAMGNDSVR